MEVAFNSLESYEQSFLALFRNSAAKVLQVIYTYMYIDRRKWNKTKKDKKKARCKLTCDYCR